MTRETLVLLPRKMPLWQRAPLLRSENLSNCTSHKTLYLCSTSNIAATAAAAMENLFLAMTARLP